MPAKPKKTPKTTQSKDRVVYEVKGPQGTKQIDAATTAELKNHLSKLLPLEPYSAQGAAHLAHVDRATITGQGWSVKRLGVLAFVPDETPAAKRDQVQPQSPTEQPTHAPEMPDESPALDQPEPAPTEDPAGVVLHNFLDTDSPAHQ